MRVIKITNNKIIECKEVTNGYVLQSGESESITGELGQIMQADGSFINENTPISEKPISELEAKVNYIYLKQKGLI